MRFALVIYGTLDTLSGGYLYDRRLVAHLRAAGDSVEIVSLPWRDYAQHLSDNTDALAARLSALDVDVLLQDELNHPSLIAANRVLRGRVPIVSIVHHLRVSEAHPPELERAHRFVERAYLRTCDAFVYNSQTTRASVETLLGAAPLHVVAYPAGDRFGEIPVIDSPRSLQSPPRVLCVGNVIERKGLHTLIEALPGNDWHLRIAGRADVAPAYTTQLQARISELGLQARVHWLGRLDDAELAHEFATSDVCAMPSQYEGFGIVYLEAMQFGLPVIASVAGAASEIVSDGIDGFVVPPDRPDAVAAALAHLRDPATHARMSSAARARFARQPGWAQSCETIRQFLYRLA